MTSVFDMIHERFPDLFSHPRDESMRSRKRRSINASDILIAISETTKKDLISYYGIAPERVKVIHLAAGSAFEGVGDEAPPRRRPYLLYVGNRARYKNTARLLEAYAAWSGRSSTDMVMAGPPFTRHERKALYDLGISKMVSSIAHPDDKALGALYRHAIALVYPSLYEGFGIPLVEAMTTGCPIIASRIPSSLEVAGEAATYFDPTDHEGLLQCFEDVLDDTQRETLIRKGRRRARLFDWNVSANKLAQVYQSVSLMM